MHTTTTQTPLVTGKDWRVTARRALRRMFRPPRRIRPTRAGLFALGFPFVLGLAAINASNNLLFMLLGAVLGVIVLSGVISERNLYGITVDVRPMSEIRAGEPARFLVDIQRPEAEPDDPPAFGIRVREEALRGEEARRRKKKDKKDRKKKHAAPAHDSLDAVLPVLEGRAGRCFGMRRFDRRGPASLRLLEVTTQYPFALLTKAKDLPTELTVLVWPRRVDVPAALADPSGATSDGRSEARRGLGQDVYGLRERDDRDPIQRIHALRSLRLGRDVVVETEAMRRPMAYVAIANVAGAHPEAFERAIEIAAATIAEWDRRGFAVGLSTAGEAIPPGAATVPELLDVLSCLPLVPSIETGATSVEGSPMWLVPTGVRLPDQVADRASSVFEISPLGALSRPRSDEEAAS